MVSTLPCGSVRVRTPPRGSDRVSASFQKQSGCGVRYRQDGTVAMDLEYRKYATHDSANVVPANRGSIDPVGRHSYLCLTQTGEGGGKVRGARW